AHARGRRSRGQAPAHPHRRDRAHVRDAGRLRRLQRAAVRRDHGPREALHRIPPPQGRPPLSAPPRRPPRPAHRSHHTNREDPMTTFSRALIEVTIAAPAEDVWKSLRDRERIGQWFGWDSDSLPAEIEFIFFKRATGDEDARTLTFGMGDRVEVEPRGADTV